MASLIRPAASLLVFFSVLTGLLYPALVTGIAQAVFPRQANGSLLHASDGHVVGSSLIGQSFVDDGYFWSRPSAIGYDAATSSGSNLGPSNPALRSAVNDRIQVLRAADAADHAAVPVDLVTASGSGLDPEISPAAAYHQVSRVARLRKLPEAKVTALLNAHVKARTFGLLGEARVNVLELNLALDALAPRS